MEHGNIYAVGTTGGGLPEGPRVVILRPPHGPMTREDALNLAAWIVALADRNNEFEHLLDEVRNT